MAALVLAPDHGYTADWHPANGIQSARLVTSRSLVAVASLMEDLARAEFSDEQLEIFEMRVRELSARCALAQCFMDGVSATGAD